MIYRLDKQNNRIIPCDETNFKSNSIFERKHIEKWIEDYPIILGEELLVITTEFDRFDKTNERLDILVLDTDGNLVIIELKRDDSGKNVDLQAIKYAAYCSTLRLIDVCQIHQTYCMKKGDNFNEDQVRDKILKFIKNEDFEEISERPRIILVSKQFRTEVTASVIWLRKFGVDISCVKLTPYEISKGEIALESNIMIPLPEARDFIIEIEKKENKTLTVSQVEYIEFFEDLIKRLSSIIPRVYTSPQPKSYYFIPTGFGSIHYEWGFHGRPRSGFGVELHFERSNRDSNLEALSKLRSEFPRLEKELNETIIIQEEWGSNWSRIYIEKEEGHFSDELKEWAVEKMSIFIKILQPVFDASR